MDLGMLWYDDDAKRSLSEKVQRAAEFYQAKYGQLANQCFVHPSALAPDGAPISVGIIRVQPMRTIIKGHMWLGVDKTD